MKVVGFIDIESELIFDDSILGNDYKVKISGTNYTLHLPRLDDKLQNKNENHLLPVPLKAPEILENLKTNIDYGITREFKNSIYGSNIFKIAVSFEDNDKEDLSHNLYNNIDKWSCDLIKILKIMSNGINRKGEMQSTGKSIRLYKYEDDKLTRIINNNSISIFLFIFNKDNISVSKNKFNRALKLLNNGITIPTEYEYYLSAVEYYENKNYRHSVLDASTSIELLITRLIEDIATEKHLKLSNNFLNSYHGISSKCKLLSFLGEDLKGNIELINKPRNKAIHGGIDISEEETILCLKETRLLLDRYIKFY